MSWISDRLKNRFSFKKKKAIRQSRGDAVFEERAAQCWIRLTDGLQWDAKQLQRIKSGASFKQLSDYECRISNPSAKIAVGVNADLAARTISYRYEPQQTNIAVPEPGLLALREGKNSVELYSADQRLSPEQARRMILEPLLSPGIPMELRKTAT